MLLYLIALVLVAEGILLTRGEPSLIDRAIPGSVTGAHWLRTSPYFLAAAGSFYIGWTHE